MHVERCGRKSRGASARLLAASLLLAAAACGGGDRAAERDEAVRRAEQIAGFARAAGPMPAGAFRARISAAPPPVMKAGQRETIRVRVRHAGDAVWPAHGREEDGYFQVNLGNRWRDATGRTVEDGAYVRSSFPADVRPGEEIELPLVVNAPRAPGEYTLELDLVQEMVGWFGDKGSETFKTTVRVE